MEEDSGGNSNTLVWILGGLVLVAAVGALIISVVALNSTVDQDQIVKDTKAELKNELAGLNGAIAASKEASDAANRQAARDRRRIKREVAEAVAGSEKRLNHLSAEAKELQAQTTKLRKQDNSLENEVNDLTVGQEQLESEVIRLNKRVRNLGGG
jgi:uncharacterized protein (DUF3084 family)